MPPCLHPTDQLLAMHATRYDGAWFGWWPYAVMLLLAAIAVIILAVRTHGLLSKRPEGLRLHDTEREARRAPRFSTSLRFDPYPSTVNIENRYDCNADSLRRCLVDDPTTLFGCRELAVRCVHFDKDTEYRSNGSSRTIPKNARPEEGYALALTTLMESCNPYHGDPVLVAANAESNEYMLLCQCKNPGYIGNVHLLGACDTPFVCNGKVESLDRPLDQVECKCGPAETTKRYADGMPICKRLLVWEANARYDDWSSLVQWKSPRMLETRHFNPTIRDNVRSSVLLDPCSNSVHDTSVAIPNGQFDPTNNTCRFKDYGYPIETDVLRSSKPTAEQIKSAKADAEARLLSEQPFTSDSEDDTKKKAKRSIASSSSVGDDSSGDGDKNLDAADSRKRRWLVGGEYVMPSMKRRRLKRRTPAKEELDAARNAAASNLDMIDVGGGLYTERYNRIRFTDNVSGRRKLAVIEARLPSVPETATLGELLLKTPDGIGLVAQLTIDSSASFVAPQCQGSWPRYHCYLNEYFQRFDLGLPRPGERAVPSDVWFPWNQEDWYTTEQMYRLSVRVTSRGCAIDQREFTVLPNARTYGLTYYHRDYGHRNGILSFGDQKSYDKHRSVLT